MGEEVLRAEHFQVPHPFSYGKNIVEDVSFTLHKGEILGLAGLVGAGRSELVSAIFGAMTSEQLEELQMSLHLGLERQGGKDARPSIGLCNVYRRLQAFYGNDLRFSIDSEVGCGTVISISLPMEGCA